MPLQPNHWLLILGSLYVPDEGSPGGRRRVVHQRVLAGLGNNGRHAGHDLQLRAHVIPYDPRTQLQRALRDRMRAATLWWQGLDEVSRDAYLPAAELRGITRYQAAISAYCLAHPIDPASLITDPPRPVTTGALMHLGHPSRFALSPPVRAAARLFSSA